MSSSSASLRRQRSDNNDANPNTQLKRTKKPQTSFQALSVKMLHQTTLHEQKTFKLFGEQIGYAKIVGRALNVRAGGFDLCDLNGPETIHIAMTDEMQELASRIVRENEYVLANGLLMPPSSYDGDKQKQFQPTVLRRVSGPDELTLHNLEVMYCQEYRNRAQQGKSTMYAFVKPGEVAKAPKGDSDPSAIVLSALRSSFDNEDGLTVEEIQKMTPSLDTSTVLQITEKMVDDDGSVYVTTYEPRRFHAVTQAE